MFFTFWKKADLNHPHFKSTAQYIFIQILKWYTYELKVRFIENNEERREGTTHRNNKNNDFLKSVFCYAVSVLPNVYGEWYMPNATRITMYYAPISIFFSVVAFGIQNSTFGTWLLSAHSSWLSGSFFILFADVRMFISNFSSDHEPEYIFTIVFHLNGRISFGVWPCDTWLNMHFILCGFYCDVDFSFRLTLFDFIAHRFFVPLEWIDNVYSSIMHGI